METFGRGFRRGRETCAERGERRSSVDSSNPDRGDPMPAQGAAISSVSENSRNPGYQMKVGTKNPNGVALTFSRSAQSQRAVNDVNEHFG